MMTPQQLEQAIVDATQRNAALRSENETSQVQYVALHRDYTALNAQYLTLSQTINSVIADRDAQQQKVAELEVVNKKLTDMLWGRRSERRLDGSMTPLLNFGDDPQSPAVDSIETLGPEVIAAQVAAQAAYDAAKLAELEARRQARKTRQAGEASREAFPSNLERRERILDLPEEQKAGLKLFSTKISERLRFEKPTVYVERIVRHLYVQEDVVDPSTSPVIAAAALPSIVEGCKYDFSIIAAVVSMKFAFHMPTYREQDFFGQSGWRPSRSTSNDLINYAVACIDPLFTQLSQCLMALSILFGDATEITVLLQDPLSDDDQQQLDQRKKNRHKELQAKLNAKRSKTASSHSTKNSTKNGSATSYAWLYSGLDAPQELQPDLSVPRPERPPPNFDDPLWRYAPYNIFHWSLTQKHAVIDAHLADFHGTFVGDAAGANANLAARSGNRIAHQSCNAHARRYFIKAQANDPVLASQMVAMYRQLYAVEYRGAELNATERLELRQRDAVPIWQRIQAWLDQDEVKRLLPKSAISEAVGYLRNQWDALRRYLTDGHMPFDNNHSERVIRPLTIGRKNWLFFGSPEAAPGRMKLFSIVSSAHRHCLSIQDYLQDIFLKLSQASQHSPQDLEPGSALLLSLLPDRWAATHPEHVHHERLADKQQAAEDKRFYRLQAGLAGVHPYAAAASLKLSAE
jgi:transposase